MITNGLPRVSWDSKDKFLFEYPMKNLDTYNVGVHRDCQIALEHVIGWCEAVARGEAPALVLWGNTGAGKTHLLFGAWAALLYLDQPPALKVWSMPSVFDGIRAGYGRQRNGNEGNPPRKVPEWDGISRRDWGVWLDARDIDIQEVLVGWQGFFLDDVGAEHISGEGTAWAQVQYMAIIGACYDNSLPLFMSTNLSPVELAIRLGPRAYSRLTEMATQNGFVNMSRIPDYRVRRAMA